jgi:hypothetical protein
MHPAAGVQCSELKYPEFARAMGVDPSTNVTISYALQDKKYASNFMELVLKPLANQGGVMNGIDYWWIDYQQGEALIAPAVNPTYWVNYVFASSTSWWGQNTRPVIMARWGGLGNHRFSDIGFSGDTHTSWNTLAFQPYFTVTAANVGFFWSHDLGGFSGQPEPELFVRWIQWGAFSNMLRTHCDGKAAGFTRDIWDYPHQYYTIMRDAFLLRSKLIPYIYTQHFIGYLTGSGLLKPMYLLYPEDDNAYKYQGQYMFGTDMFVSPVVTPSKSSNITLQTVWIPPGSWVEYSSGEVFQGPSVQQRYYALDEIPIFVVAGAILPTRSDIDTPTIGSAQQIPSILRFEVISPMNTKSSAVVIEDDGITTSYQNDAYATTRVTLSSDASNVELTVNPVTGSFVGMRLQRSYQFYFTNVFPANNVQVNGKSINFVADPLDDFSTDFWTYDRSSLAVLVNLATQYPVNTPVVAKLSFTYANSATTRSLSRRIDRAQACKDLLDVEWGKYFPSDYPSVLLVTDYALNATASEVTPDYIAKFTQLFGRAVAEVTTLSPTTADKTACYDLLNTA